MMQHLTKTFEKIHGEVEEKYKHIYRIQDTPGTGTLIDSRTRFRNGYEFGFEVLS